MPCPNLARGVEYTNVMLFNKQGLIEGDLKKDYKLNKLPTNAEVNNDQKMSFISRLLFFLITWFSVALILTFVFLHYRYGSYIKNGDFIGFYQTFNLWFTFDLIFRGPIILRLQYEVINFTEYLSYGLFVICHLLMIAFVIAWCHSKFWSKKISVCLILIWGLLGFSYNLFLSNVVH